MDEIIPTIEQVSQPIGKGRFRFYDGPYLVAYGDRDRAVFVFKSEPATFQNNTFYHKSVGNYLRIEDPSLVGSITHLTAFALLKGRGCLVQQLNPTNKNLATVKPWEPMVIGAQEGPLEDSMNVVYMRPFEKKWIDGWTFLDQILRIHYSPPPNEIDEALKAWGRAFAPPCCSPQMNIHDIASWIVDGLTETIVPPLKPKERRVQKPLMQIDLSYNITQDSDADYVFPLDLDKMMTFKGPKMRKLLRHGGLKNFIELCTGTACKSMVKVMTPGICRISPISAAATTFDSHPGYPTMVRDELTVIRPLMDSLSIDHRVKLMELMFKNDGRNLHVDIIRNDNQVKGLMEFFTIANPTKIIEKCAESMGIRDRVMPYAGEPIANVPVDVAQFVAEHELQLIDPFSAMIDAGSQLRKWREAFAKKRFNKKQMKYFPEGLKIKSRWNSIKEIHDDISKQANKLESLGERVLMPWHDTLRKLHGARCGSLRLLLPRTNRVLVRWGKEQNHCVGSMYNERMQKGECAIVGVFSEGKIKYCVRLTPVLEAKLSKTQPEDKRTESNYDRKITGWTLAEFRGKGNKWPEAKDAAETIEAMLAAGVDISGWINSGNGYGAPKDGKWNEEYIKAAADVPDGTIIVDPIENFPEPEDETK